MRSTLNGFSLVEATISLGIVAFALVGIMGALPLAMGSARYSVEQTRAATIANTLFVNFRTQPFSKVFYLSNGHGTPVDLSVDNQPVSFDTSNSRNFYVAFTDGVTTGEAMQFQSSPAGAEYAVALGFNSQPGTTAGATGSAGATMPSSGLANQIEVAVYAVDHPKDIYRFVSVVANRAQ